MGAEQAAWGIVPGGVRLSRVRVYHLSEIHLLLYCTKREDLDLLNFQSRFLDMDVVLPLHSPKLYRLNMPPFDI